MQLNLLYVMDVIFKLWHFKVIYLKDVFLTCVYVDYYYLLCSYCAYKVSNVTSTSNIPVGKKYIMLYCKTAFKLVHMYFCKHLS